MEVLARGPPLDHRQRNHNSSIGGRRFSSAGRTPDKTVEPHLGNSRRNLRGRIFFPTTLEARPTWPTGASRPFAVAQVSERPQMKPKLSQRTLDLMRHTIEAAGSWDEQLVEELVSSAYVDGAAEMLSRLRGVVIGRKKFADGEK